MRALVLVATLLACAACAPRDAAVRRARLAAERRNLEAELDRLEDRLVETQSRVHFWKEMRARHESVAAIACAGLEEHAQEMAMGRLSGDAKRAELYSALHRARLAAVPAPGAPAPRPSPAAQ